MKASPVDSVEGKVKSDNVFPWVFLATSPFFVFAFMLMLWAVSTKSTQADCPQYPGSGDTVLINCCSVTGIVRFVWVDASLCATNYQVRYVDRVGCIHDIECWPFELTKLRIVEDAK